MAPQNAIQNRVHFINVRAASYALIRADEAILVFRFHEKLAAIVPTVNSNAPLRQHLLFVLSAAVSFLR